MLIRVEKVVEVLLEEVEEREGVHKAAEVVDDDDAAAAAAACASCDVWRRISFNRRSYMNISTISTSVCIEGGGDDGDDDTNDDTTTEEYGGARGETIGKVVTALFSFVLITFGQPTTVLEACEVVVV